MHLAVDKRDSQPYKGESGEKDAVRWKYPLNPEGLVEMTTRNDIASIRISANKVITLNFLISIELPMIKVYS